MDEVSKLLVSLYAASREYPLDDFQDAALRLVKRQLSFTSAVWGSGLFTARGLTYHSVHLHNERGDLPVLYEEVQHEDAVAFRAWHDAAHTQRFHAPVLYAGRSKSGIRQYAAAVGHQNGLSSWERAPETNLIHWIGLYRERSEDQYTEREMHYMVCLAPHLREALRINRLLHMERLNRESHSYHAAIGDLQGFLYSAEAGFLELVKAECPRWNRVSLPRALLDALAATSHQYTGNEVVVRCRPAGSLMFLRIRRKRAADSLTERERAVALHVARGSTHKVIARALGISPATVRSHIQHIHQKLDLHTNAEIAAHVLVD